MDKAPKVGAAVSPERKQEALGHERLPVQRSDGRRHAVQRTLRL